MTFKNRGIRIVHFLREPVNGLTHCIGALLACAGLVVLIIKASDPVKPWHITTFSIFGAAGFAATGRAVATLWVDEV